MSVSDHSSFPVNYLICKNFHSFLSQCVCVKGSHIHSWNRKYKLWLCQIENFPPDLDQVRKLKKFKISTQKISTALQEACFLPKRVNSCPSQMSGIWTTNINNFHFSFFRHIKLSRQIRTFIRTLGNTMFTRHDTIKMGMFDWK